MGLSIGKDIIVNNDGRENLNIEWSKFDRQSNVLHGHRIDNPKIKVVKIGLQTPEVPTGLITLKQDSKKPVEFEMKSFTRNYYNRLTSQMMGLNGIALGTTGGAGYLNVRTTSGSWDTEILHYYSPRISAGYAETQSSYEWSTALGTTISGILIGSSSSVFSFEDYALTGYTHGFASGNIYHSANNPFFVSYNAGTRVWTSSHSRFFANCSGATISNINELGIVKINSSPSYYTLEERSVLEAPITLLNRVILRVTYLRNYTFPNTVDWTRNAYNAWLSNSCLLGNPGPTFGAGLRSGKVTSGSVIAVASAHFVLMKDNASGYVEGANLSNCGILVGIGNDVESLEDYALATKKAHSASFTYGANTRLSTNYTSGSKTYLTQLSRQVNNVSAGSTVITEIGLVVYGYIDNNQYFLLARKVLASPVTLENSESLQVIYEISSVYPA